MATIDQYRVRQILQDPNVFATTCLILCIDAFGIEFFEWEPETLTIEAKNEWGIELPGATRDKIWALVTLLTTDQFERNVELFMQVCNTLSGAGVSFNSFDEVEPEEIAWALTEVETVDPDPNRKYSGEIRRFIGLTLEQNGITKPPKVLDLAVFGTSEPFTRDTDAIGADPALVKSYMTRQSQEAADIDQTITERLLELLHQLQGLPLQNGQTAGLDDLISRVAKLQVRQSQNLEQASVPVGGPRSVL